MDWELLELSNELWIGISVSVISIIIIGWIVKVLTASKQETV